jgi:D-amino-acid dehydrogenase
LSHFAKVGGPQEVERISHALAAINSRVYNDLLPMLRDTGLTAELHRTGALTLYETEAGYDRDAAAWACKRSRGVDVQEMTGAQAREMEPSLGPRVQRAVFTPQWSHVSDPRNLVDGLRRWLVNRGVAVHAGQVRSVVNKSASSISLSLDDGSRVPADRVVIAAGAWSSILANQLGDRALLESERGYNMTLPSPGIKVGRQSIFAERRFVATPLSCGLRIGGAAEFGGLDSAPNFQRSRRLVELAAEYLPGLQMQDGTSWAGHRPATPDSLPVISRSMHQPKVFYAFGHGHLGLTQAATTGRLVYELVLGKVPSIDMAPYAINRFSQPTLKIS